MIIKERTNDDCAICAIAMATGSTYETVVAAAGPDYVPGVGTDNECRILAALGYGPDDILCISLPKSASPAVYYKMMWGRRALVGLPSLNHPAPAAHMLFWDGAQVLDPSNKQIYTLLEQLKPETVIMFKADGEMNDLTTFRDYRLDAAISIMDRNAR